MTVSRDSMATAMLAKIGKPISVNNVHSMVCWMASENTTAEWNPCATERGEPDDTNFNSDGVKNYPTIEEGLQGFYDTINNGSYGTILDCLTGSSVPAETCAMIVNSPWGSKPTPQVVADVLTNWEAESSVVIGGSADAPTEPSEPEPTPPPIEVPTTPTEDDVQVPTISNTNNMTTVRLPVKSIQAILNVQSGAGLTVDGIYGPATEGAVKAWQNFWRITVDGIVGPQTWGTLINL